MIQPLHLDDTTIYHGTTIREWPEGWYLNTRIKELNGYLFIIQIRDSQILMYTDDDDQRWAQEAKDSANFKDPYVKLAGVLMT